MYDKLRAKGMPLATEVEFRAYHLLTLIGTHGRYGYNAAEYQNALSVPLQPNGTSMNTCLSNILSPLGQSWIICWAFHMLW